MLFITWYKIEHLGALNWNTYTSNNIKTHIIILANYISTLSIVNKIIFH